MFIPDKVTLVAWKGATFTHRFTWLVGGEGSAARDLTGYSATFVIRDTNGATLLSLSDPADITLGGIAGTLDITIPAATILAATWKTGIYELLVTSPASQVDPLVWGSFAIKGTQ